MRLCNNVVYCSRNRSENLLHFCFSNRFEQDIITSLYLVEGSSIALRSLVWEYLFWGSRKETVI